MKKRNYQGDLKKHTNTILPSLNRGPWGDSRYLGN